MQHGSRTKYHLLDPGFDLGEVQWMNRRWAKHGRTRQSDCVAWYKWQFVKAERRRGKRECLQQRREDESE